MENLLLVLIFGIGICVIALLGELLAKIFKWN
jgi:hypothetical protein